MYRTTNMIRRLINAATGVPNYWVAEECIEESDRELDNLVAESAAAQNAATATTTQNATTIFVPKGLIPIIPDHIVQKQKYFLEDLVYQYGPYDHILSFLRGPLKFVSVKIMLHAIRARAFSMSRAQKYIDMIISNRLPPKGITNEDVYNLQERTGITNEEIVDYIIINKQSPKVDGLLELLHDLIDPRLMTSIVYSKRSLNLLKKTWNNLFANSVNDLWIFLENFDIECYRYLWREQPEYVMIVMNKPISDWRPGHSEIIHTMFLTVFLDQGLNDLAEAVIQKYGVPEADFMLALSRLLRANLFKTIVYLYDNIPCADLQISARDLLNVPIILHDDDFKVVLQKVVGRQTMTNELYVLMFMHFPAEKVLEEVPSITDLEGLKKMVIRIGRDPFFVGSNYDYIMNL